MKINEKSENYILLKINNFVAIIYAFRQKNPTELKKSVNI